jgi:ABC-type lipoprotein release transport system permease subunit
LRRFGVLPRVAQIGVRNVGRRKRRSLATALMVALAVGNLLAVLAMAAAATEATQAAWGDHLEDVQISTGGRALFDARAQEEMRSTQGVQEAEPVLKNSVELEGREAFVWAVEHEPLFRYRLSDGRWFTADEERGSDRVAVVERNIAQLSGISVGDAVALDTATGTAEFRVVGIAKNQQEDGTAVYVPLTTARSLLNRPEGASAYWIDFESDDHAAIDRATGQLEDRLADLGYEVTSEITYIAERDEVAANRSLTTSIAVLGFVIVAMSMVGLANAITTNVLERTREIGIMRSIGARARDVRRIFTTEGLALAVVGWLGGIPLGYALTRMLVRLVWEVVDVRLPVVFPLWNVVIALAGTLVLALLVLFLPVRRAVRLRPGEALRYG